jgi:3-phosphoshikimate 1-carboxyvinyltransferase
MLLTILGLSAAAPIRITGAHHIRKSYPLFFRHLEELGAHFEYPEATRA